VKKLQRILHYLGHW